jgi:hypothetical protein
MPFAEYLRVEGVNWSSLKHLERSPKHYQFERIPPPSETRAMVKGRAGHTATLEPDLYPTEYVVFPGSRRAGKDWDLFEAENTDRTILTRREDEDARAIGTAVRAHPFAAKLLGNGKPEQTIEWNDPETGIKCKGRIDFLQEEGFLDLKTTASIDRRRFSATAFNLRYHAQMAFYARGMAALGVEWPVIHMIAVESVPPYDVAVFEVMADELAIGDELVGKLLNRLAECEATKEWPGSCPGVERMYLPSWAYKEESAESVGLIIGNQESEAA